MRWTTVRLAVRNLLLQKLRSFLTMLGTILGVASVIAMLAIGEGSKREAVEQIRKLGANNIIIRSVKPGEKRRASGATASATETQQSSLWMLDYGLTYKDLEILEATLPTVRSTVAASVLKKDVQRGRYSMSNARVVGTTPEFLETAHLVVDRGRFLTGPDIRLMSNVAVLGAAAATKLFSYEDPLEKVILIGEGAYRVVGILRAQGRSATPGGGESSDQDSNIWIPLTAARNRLGEVQTIYRAGSRERQRVELSEITLTVHDEKDSRGTATMARAVLLRTHPEGDDFSIQVPIELLEQAEREKRIWNIVLGSIAGISLLVGGIGIMNIMLATITERTREIGIRRALGARRGDITKQFLIETMVLSASGGVLGILVGVSIPLLVESSFGIEAALSWWSVLLAFGISVGVGVVFGIYPARRAARMDPIEALRHR